MQYLLSESEHQSNLDNLETIKKLQNKIINLEEQLKDQEKKAGLAELQEEYNDLERKFYHCHNDLYTIMGILSWYRNYLYQYANKKSWWFRLTHNAWKFITTRNGTDEITIKRIRKEYDF